MDRVVAGLLRRDGQVLLCHRRHDRRHYPDVWDLPGGRVEPGESLVDALRRELEEELGIIAMPAEKTPLVTLTADNLRLDIYLVDNWLGEIRNLAPDEHDELRWTSPTEAAGLKLADDSYVKLLQRALA